MGNLITLGFNRSWAANEVLNKFLSETALEDAFVVKRAASGRCIIRRALDLITPAAAAGPFNTGLWGAMVRLLFLNPSLDVAIPRGGSALFILLENAVGDRVLTAVKPFRARIQLRTASSLLA